MSALFTNLLFQNFAFTESSGPVIATPWEEQGHYRLQCRSLLQVVDANHEEEEAVASIQRTGIPRAGWIPTLHVGSVEVRNQKYWR
jgi:hypothetical protein